MIKISNIVKTYGQGANRVTALNGLSFEIGDGEAIAVTGKSGAGKSTLLNIIGAVHRPDSGNVEYNGTNITELNEKQLLSFRNKRIGFVFQNYRLISELTVKENITLPALIASKKYDKERFELLTASLGIDGLLLRYPNEISGGELQRAAIARALINKPAVLLCDEPTGNLDSETSAAVMETILKISRETNQTVIIATHDSDVMKYTDRTLHIKDGMA
ncbi:MAG: ABC transporter ATP-binding protein [Bacteroides sp.]|nr:ABC transporter ATP-binding protein [Bacteroides sp.]